MKRYRAIACPAYDNSGLCKKYKTICKRKQACIIKKVINRCMESEEDIFNPKGTQNQYIVIKLGIMK